MEQEKISVAQLRAARALLGLTQAKLAERAGISAMTVKRAEGSGIPYPSQETITVIIKALKDQGAIFIPENGEGPGVRLKKG